MLATSSRENSNSNNTNYVICQDPTVVLFALSLCLSLFCLSFWQNLPGRGLPDAIVDQGARLHRGPSEAAEGDGEAAAGVHEPQHCEGGGVAATIASSRF